MTVVHRLEAVLAEDGKLLLDRLPFRAGQTVEVIVLATGESRFPDASLRGTVLRYDRPTEPLAEVDWDMLK